MLADAGLSARFLPWIGAGEILFSVMLLCSWNVRPVLVLNALLMLAALIAVAASSPHYLVGAFNPVSLNTVVIALSAIAFLASREIPSARKCLRSQPEDRA